MKKLSRLLRSSIILAVGIALTFTLSGTDAFASAELLIQGKIYSITYDQFVILSSGKLYYLNKEKLDKTEAAALQKYPRGPVSLHVQAKAIDYVKNAPPTAH